MCGPNCFDNWSPVGLIQSHRPIKGGWSIQELPDTIPEKFRWAWRNRRRTSRNSTAKGAVEEAMTFLRKAGHSASKAIKESLQQRAEEEWRDRDPKRFAGAPKKATATKPEKMSWASRFWEITNLALTVNHPNPGALCHHIAELALQLLKTHLGCDHCEAHWTGVIGKYPPSDLVVTIEDARIWLWAAHNESREQHAPVPYHKIAERHGWPTIEDDLVTQTITRFGMTGLVENWNQR